MPRFLTENRGRDTVEKKRNEKCLESLQAAPQAPLSSVPAFTPPPPNLLNRGTNHLSEGRLFVELA